MDKLKTFTFNTDAIVYLKSGNKNKTEIAKGSTIDVDLLPSLGEFGDLLGKPVTHELDENGVLVAISKKEKNAAVEEKAAAPEQPRLQPTIKPVV